MHLVRTLVHGLVRLVRTLVRGLVRLVVYLCAALVRFVRDKFDVPQQILDLSSARCSYQRLAAWTLAIETRGYSECT